MAVPRVLFMVVYLEPGSWRRSGASEVRAPNDAVSGLARFPSHALPGRGGWTPNLLHCPQSFSSWGVLAMPEEPTTVIIQRYLDALPGDSAAEPVIRELLERAVGRLRLL